MREIVRSPTAGTRGAAPPRASRSTPRSSREVAPGATLTWGGLVLLGRDDDHAAEKAASRRVGPEVVYGGPVRVAKRLQALERGGAEWAILAPVDASDPENVDLLAELVMPRLAQPQTRRPDARRSRA